MFLIVNTWNLLGQGSVQCLFKAWLSNLLDTQEAQVNNCSTAAHACSPQCPCARHHLFPICESALPVIFFSFTHVQANRYLSLPTRPSWTPNSRWESPTCHQYPHRGHRPGRWVGLTCYPLFRELLLMNYYQRTEAIWAVPLSLYVISNVLATFLLGVSS